MEKVEFKELTVEELTQGLTYNEHNTHCTCIFCGQVFETGLIYNSRGRQVNARRAADEHIFDAHGGVFNGLVSIDRQVSGLSDIQKDIMTGIYQDKDNKALAQEMGISLATVRTHKFNLQKAKREARILLAIMEQLENEEIIAHRKLMETETDEELQTPKLEKEYCNTLHPFFNQYNLR